MTFKELHDVIDRHWDSSEILVLEFKGNGEFNRVRSDCVDLLNPISHYEVDSIGVNEDGEQVIWLNRPTVEQTERSE